MRLYRREEKGLQATPGREFLQLTFISNIPKVANTVILTAPGALHSPKKSPSLFTLSTQNPEHIMELFLSSHCR